MPVPLVFADRYLEKQEGDQWINLYEEEGRMKVDMLIYSNSQIMDAYLESELWSTNYFRQKKAQRFAQYTDGYACQLHFTAATG